MEILSTIRYVVDYPLFAVYGSDIRFGFFVVMLILAHSAIMSTICLLQIWRTNQIVKNADSEGRMSPDYFEYKENAMQRIRYCTILGFPLTWIGVIVLFTTFVVAETMRDMFSGSIEKLKFVYGWRFREGAGKYEKEMKKSRGK